MTKVLIDMALIAIAMMAGSSIISSGRKFAVLFTQLREELATGVPMQAMRVTTRSTVVDSAMSPIPAMAYQPGMGVIDNPAGALIVTSRAVKSAGRRSAAMRAAA